VVALALSAAAIAVFTPLTTAVASAEACTQYHNAKPNDSWSRIAARFGIGQRQLLQINNAQSSTALYVGDRVCVSTQPKITIPSETFTRREVIAIIREVWPDKHEENALFVAKRESNYTPSVIGGTSNCCYGLFQMYWSVHRSWLSRMGITEPSQLLDPRTNAEAALALFRRNGGSWRPWWTSSWRP
jgi:LysM repeat protein